MDDYNELNNIFQRSNQVLKNAQIGPSIGSVAPPIPSLTTTRTPLLDSNPPTYALNPPSFVPNPPTYAPNFPSSIPVAASSGSGANNSTSQRSHRRVPMQYGLPPNNVYGGGGYNNHPFNRPYMNMNMNLGGAYNPYSSYRHPINNQYENPVIIAAAENSRPAFESIQSVVQSFNAISMMLDSTLTAIYMSFEALLGVAENFTRLRTFMMKLYSSIVTFKLARWFLTKIFYLLRMVRGRSGPSVDEDLWTALSSTTQGEIMPSDGRSWPLIVFTGLLAATPYFVYKLLNSVTPVSNSLLTPNSARPGSRMAIRAQNNWSSSDPKTISLVKGNMYHTTNSLFEHSNHNGGWLYVEASNKQKGYAPLVMFRINKTVPPVHQPVLPDTPNVTSQIPPNNPEQLQQLPPMSMTDDNIEPSMLPHPLDDGNK